LFSLKKPRRAPRTSGQSDAELGHAHPDRESGGSMAARVISEANAGQTMC